MKILESEHLIFRPFKETDFDAVHSYASVAENVEYAQPCLNDEERTKNFIANAIQKSNTEPCMNYQYALICKADNKLIGGGNLALYDNEEAEIGWMLHKDYWRQGFGTEIGATLMRFGFDELNLHRIIAHCHSCNHASYRIMERLGMRREGCFVEGRHAAIGSSDKYADEYSYAILRSEYSGGLPANGTRFDIAFTEEENTNQSEQPNVSVLKASTDLMFYNLHIAMDTVDWNANISGAPAWRYIYHTLNSMDKWFINPCKRFDEPEPPFHTPKLDQPDTPSDIILSRETLYAYYDQVRKKVLDYVGNLNDAQLSEQPEGCINTRLGLAFSQFRHMYAHIGILNGITIAATGQYPRVLNESTWMSRGLPEGLYDVEER